MKWETAVADAPPPGFVIGGTMNVDELLTRLHLPVESRMPAFSGATAWLDRQPLTPEDLQGKVVAVQFWTYTCVNWLRTLPYARAWVDAYADKGLVFVGVHTPEFGVEHDIDNVRRAVREMGIEYAVAIDNDYAVWNAFANLYWPALYVGDAEGRIRYHHFGEGGYEHSEHVIRQLLTDAGAVHLPKRDKPVAARGIELPADWKHVQSPETYTRFGRTQGFASPGGVSLDKARTYARPPRLHLNEWALAGSWTVGQEGAVSNGEHDRLAYRFHARDVNLVLTPPAGQRAVPFRVRLDGQAPADAHGLDVDEQGDGVLEASRLYQLIRQSGSISDREFEIELLAPGATALCFTFG